MIDFTKVYSQFTEDESLRHVPKEKQQEIVIGILTRRIAEEIAKHIDDKVINYKVELDQDTGMQSHTLKINLISDEEIIRLRQVEEELKELRYGK